MIVLDTDIVPLFAYGNEKIRKRVEDVEEDETLAVTLITHMEILQGRHNSILKAANAAEKQMVVQRCQAAKGRLYDFAELYPNETSCGHFQDLMLPFEEDFEMCRVRVCVIIADSKDSLLLATSPRQEAFESKTLLKRSNSAVKASLPPF
jgi:hypothetical protein